MLDETFEYLENEKVIALSLFLTFVIEVITSSVLCARSAKQEVKKK